MRDQVNFYQQRWDERKQMFARAKRHGRVLVLTAGSRIQVVAPQDEGFTKIARELGADWKARSGVWSFKGSQVQPVADAIARIFGAEQVPEWMQAKLKGEQ